MLVEKIEIYHVKMELVSPFKTAFGVEEAVEHIIIRIESEGLTGWGECSVFSNPFYTYETTKTAWHILENFLIPTFIDKNITNISQVIELMKNVKGHNMAKAGIESAIWDLFAKEKNISLSNMLGGNRKVVDVGVSIGIQNSTPQLLENISKYLEQGYKRIKIKIAPSNDIKLLDAIRKEFSEIFLQVDANSAYTIEDLDLFRSIDKYNLLLIEQPFAEDDFIDHAKLQNEIETPICLDESIKNFTDVRTALEFGSCKVINIKPARVGGFFEAQKIHDLCAEKKIPVWQGGMLESGIGRAGITALASLPNFTLPGDISASERYFKLDIIEPPFTLNSDGTITVPTSPGIGVDVQIDRLERVTVQKAVYKC